MNHWGLSTSVNLFGCNPSKIRDEGVIKQFAHDLVVILDMVAFGDPIVVNFGKDDKKGYTLVQLIETSSIVAHFVENVNAAYLDIFSCKEYDPEMVAEFCKEFFNAQDMSLYPLYR